MKLVRPSRAQMREWVQPRSLSWRGARTVFLLANGVGFAAVGFYLLIHLLVGGPAFTFGTIFPIVCLFVMLGRTLDWRSRGKLLLAITAGAALPFYVASEWPSVFRATAWVFHIFLLIFVPMVWLMLDANQNDGRRPSRKQG